MTIALLLRGIVMEAKCPKCEDTDPRHFAKNRTRKTGLQVYCRECQKGVQRESQNEVARRPNRRRWNLKNRYGIGEEQYQELLLKQGGVCAICKEHETRKRERGGDPVRLSVDHDHNCCPGKKSCGKCVRALLCFRCNQLLGLCHDDITVLQAAIEFLHQRKGERFPSP